MKNPHSNKNKSPQFKNMKSVVGPQGGSTGKYERVASPTRTAPAKHKSTSDFKPKASGPSSMRPHANTGPNRVTGTKNTPVNTRKIPAWKKVSGMTDKEKQDYFKKKGK